MKKTPAAFREQLAKVGTRVLAGDLDRVKARDKLTRWLKRYDRPLVDAICREFASDRLDDYLRRRAANLAEQLALGRWKGHGYVGYTLGCRCSECREAKRDYMRSRRAAGLESDPRRRHDVPRQATS